MLGFEDTFRGAVLDVRLELDRFDDRLAVFSTDFVLVRLDVFLLGVFSKLFLLEVLVLVLLEELLLARPDPVNERRVFLDSPPLDRGGADLLGDLVLGDAGPLATTDLLGDWEEGGGGGAPMTERLGELDDGGGGGGRVLLLLLGTGLLGGRSGVTGKEDTEPVDGVF